MAGALVIAVEANAGATWNAVVYDAVQLATLTSCPVRVTVANLTLVAAPGTDPRTCLERVQTALLTGRRLVV